MPFDDRRYRPGEVLSSGATLSGIERLAVFNRLRAAFGLRWELPPLLASVSLPPRAECLEIGAGLGWGTVGLLRKEATLRVVTTEFEFAMVKRGRRFVGKYHPDARVHYAQTDAKTLPFGRARFDCVLSLYVLHHALGYRAALAEVARVLRPGGFVLLIDLIRPRWLPQPPAVIAPEGVLTRAEWHGLFRTCGLDIVRFDTRYFLGPLPRASIVARKLPDGPPAT